MRLLHKNKTHALCYTRHSIAFKQLKLPIGKSEQGYKNFQDADAIAQAAVINIHIEIYIHIYILLCMFVHPSVSLFPDFKVARTFILGCMKEYYKKQRTERLHL